jgi:hypothetical protein
MSLHVPAELLEGTKRLLRSGADNETVFAYLKRSGASLLQTISVIQHVQGIPLIDAKRLVCESSTWADVKEVFEKDLEQEADSER